MSTPIKSIVRLGRQGWAVSVPLLAAGALVAGCGTTHAGSAAPGTGARSGTSGSSAAAPVPTVTGGTAGAGQPNCVGWPDSAPNVSLPVSFVPVSVERCVTGATKVAGQDVWVTETLQKADSGLGGLVNALRQPTGTRSPNMMCPALEIVPPQLVLTDSTGQKIIPKMPRSGCGIIQSKVLAQVNRLHWTTVSVRLVSRVPAPGHSSVSGKTVGSAPAVPASQPASPGRVTP